MELLDTNPLKLQSKLSGFSSGCWRKNTLRNHCGSQKVPRTVHVALGGCGPGVRESSPRAALHSGDWSPLTHVAGQRKGRETICRRQGLPVRSQSTEPRENSSQSNTQFLVSGIFRTFFRADSCFVLAQGAGGTPWHTNHMVPPKGPYHPGLVHNSRWYWHQGESSRALHFQCNPTSSGWFKLAVNDFN